MRHPKTANIPVKPRVIVKVLSAERPIFLRQVRDNREQRWQYQEPDIGDGRLSEY